MNHFDVMTMLWRTAHWRLRAFLHSDAVDDDCVGYRAEEDLCTVARWLEFELLQSELPFAHLPSIMVFENHILWNHEAYTMPPLLVQFIRLIDEATMADVTGNAWARFDDRVSRAEALAALDAAERWCNTQLLLSAPTHTCAYPECSALVGSQALHGFSASTPKARINQRGENAGLLLASHVASTPNT